MVPGIAGVVGGGTLPPTYSYRTNGVLAATQSVFTMAGVSVGTDPDRCVCVAAFGGGPARTRDALTYGGVGMNIAFENSYTLFGYLDIDDAEPETGNVVVDWSGTKDCIGIAVWTVNGRNRKIAPRIVYGAKDGLELKASIAAVSGGVILGYGLAGGSASRTVTWTGLTERFDRYMRTIGYPEMHTGADIQLSAGDASYDTIATLSNTMADGHSILMHLR